MPFLNISRKIYAREFPNIPSKRTYWLSVWRSLMYLSTWLFSKHFGVTVFVAQDTPLGVRPGQRNIRDSMWGRLQWPYMANRDQTTLYRCSACAQSREVCKLKKELNLFYANEAFEIVAAGILSALLCTAKDSKNLVLMTERNCISPERLRLGKSYWHRGKVYFLSPN